MAHEPQWRRSTFCASGSCIECANDGEAILVRDSKLANSPILAFGTTAWKQFVAAIKEDAFAPQVTA